MLGVFLDKDSVDLGDIDCSALDRSLAEFRHYSDSEHVKNKC
jgi:hypothetical protein